MGATGGSDREVPRAVRACVGSPMRIGSYRGGHCRSPSSWATRAYRIAEVSGGPACLGSPMRIGSYRPA